MTRILLHGANGAMGRALRALLDAGFADCTAGPMVSRSGNGAFASFSEVLEPADIVLDFSFHTATEGALDFALEHGLPIVIGTTGHTQQESARIERASEQIPVFFSGNMSLGIAVLCGLVAAVVLRRMNERQNGETSGKKTNSISADKNQALQLLESSGLKGERCTLNFYEDTFTVERPGIITEYQYEGIAWIKETSKYYMIFWNRSLAIPVEKAGFYRGKKETFGGFLEKRCNKVIEKVKNA